MKKIALSFILAVSRLAVLHAFEPMTWEQAETGHFLFIYEPSSRAAVDELLGFCEEVYGEVTGFFGSYPEKVSCIVTDRVDYANGLMTPFPARLVLIVTAPYDTPFLTPAESGLKMLLAHELTHYVHLSMDGGFFAALATVFGGDAAFGSSAFLPGWMMEGIATELETRFTEGGRGRSAFFEMSYKAPILEGTLFTLDQASYSSAFPPSGRVYAAGYMLVDYLLSEYGSDAFTRIMRRYVGFPFLGPWGAIAEVTGRDASEVFSDMKKSLEERFAGAAEIPDGVRVSPDMIGDFTTPRLTSSGLYIYRNDLDRYPALTVLDPATGAEKDLLSVALTDPSSYDPTADGKTVYFTTMEFDWRNPILEEAVSDLYVLDVRTSAVRRITRGARLRHPAVSADGGRIAAVQRSGAYARLVSVDPISGAQRTVFSIPETDIYNPSFSPDGSLLTFVLNRRGCMDIHVLDADRAWAESVSEEPRAPIGEVNSGLSRAVTGPNQSGEFFPRFLDGHRILFSSDMSGSLALYVSDLDGGIGLVLKDPVGAFCGVLAGGELIYGSYGSRGFCLKRAAVDLDAPHPPAPVRNGSYPAAAAKGAVGAASAPYVDLPLLSLWMPMPFVEVTGPEGIELGLGVLAFGASRLQTWEWEVTSGYLPWSGQPVFDLGLTLDLWNITLGFRSALTYGFSEQARRYSQNLSNRLSMSLPLISRSAFGVSSGLFAWAEAGHDLSLELTSPFSVFDSFQQPMESWGSSVFFSAAMELATGLSGGNRDFFRPLEARIYVLDTHAPALFARREWGNLLVSEGSVNLPSPIAHHVLRLGAKTSYGFGDFAMRAEQTVAPRGFPDPQAFGSAGRALASADYLMSLALVDVPLIFGFNLQKVAAGVHVEVLGQWDPDSGQPALFPSAYAGIEVSALFGYTISELRPLGAGIAFAIAPQGFDPSRDIGFYFSLSFDSFWNAGRLGPGGSVSGVPKAAVPWYPTAHGD